MVVVKASDVVLRSTSLENIRKTSSQIFHFMKTISPEVRKLLHILDIFMFLNHEIDFTVIHFRKTCRTTSAGEPNFNLEIFQFKINRNHWIKFLQTWYNGKTKYRHFHDVFEIFCANPRGSSHEKRFKWKLNETYNLISHCLFDP